MNSESLENHLNIATLSDASHSLSFDQSQEASILAEHFEFLVMRTGATQLSVPMSITILEPIAEK